jgi:hypothetical protein
MLLSHSSFFEASPIVECLLADCVNWSGSWVFLHEFNDVEEGALIRSELIIVELFLYFLLDE